MKRNALLVISLDRSNNCSIETENLTPNVGTGGRGEPIAQPATGEVDKEDA